MDNKRSSLPFLETGSIPVHSEMQIRVQSGGVPAMTGIVSVADTLADASAVGPFVTARVNRTSPGAPEYGVAASFGLLDVPLLSIFAIACCR